MHLLIAIVLLISLCWNQFCAPSEPDSVLKISMLVALLALVAPAVAAIQMCIVRKVASHPKRSTIGRFRLIAIFNTLLWAGTSIAMIAWLRWGDVVNCISVAQQIPLANELLLLAPAVFSLVCSWAVIVIALPSRNIATGSTRCSMFLMWLRMQVTFVIAPILFAFLVTDCISIASTMTLTPIGETVLWILAAIAIIGATVFYPKLILLIWPTKKIEDPTQQERFNQLFQRCGMRPLPVHIWQTGNSMINAAAVGIVPGTEVILVSDLLMQKFDDEEIGAIVMHEIGHVRHFHCIKRIAMIIVPLIALGLDQSLNLGLHSTIANSEWLVSQFGSLTEFLPAIAFLLYLLIVIKTVFRKMEFEADRFAVESLAGESTTHSVELALEKMAVIYPRTVDRQSGLHPSIRQRLAYAMQVRAELEPTENTSAGHPVPAPHSISLDPVAAK